MEKAVGIIQNWKIAYGAQVSGRRSFFRLKHTVKTDDTTIPFLVLKSFSGTQIVEIKSEFSSKSKTGILIIRPFGPAVISLNSGKNLIIDQSRYNESGTIFFKVKLEKWTTIIIYS